MRRFRVLLTTTEQRTEIVKDIVFTCVVLHNMLRRHQDGVGRPPIPADNIQVPSVDQAGNGPNENFINPLREVKHQQDLLTDYTNTLGALDGQDRI